jgi:hypothetical protein
LIYCSCIFVDFVVDFFVVVFIFVFIFAFSLCCWLVGWVLRISWILSLLVSLLNDCFVVGCYYLLFCCFVFHVVGDCHILSKYCCCKLVTDIDYSVVINLLCCQFFSDCLLVASTVDDKCCYCMFSCVVFDCFCYPAAIYCDLLLVVSALYICCDLIIAISIVEN